MFSYLCLKANLDIKYSAEYCLFLIIDSKYQANIFYTFAAKQAVLFALFAYFYWKVLSYFREIYKFEYN